MRESPLPSRRFACWLPPEARVVMMTPGMALASCRFRSRAICSLERLRSSLGTRRIVICVRLPPPPPPPPPPPNPPPPPAWVETSINSGTYSLANDSSRTATSSLRSMREPTGNSALTLTSPSSACGISSKPMVGRMATAATVNAVPTARIVGR